MRRKVLSSPHVRLFDKGPTPRSWPSHSLLVRIGVLSISLPAEIAEKLDGIAAARHVSANRAIIDLLADAITAYEQRRAIFLELSNSRTASRNRPIA